MNFLIILAGCGIGDGSAIEEVILTYTVLDKYNINYIPVALNMDYISINHFTNENSETRNILFESARIGRGLIQELEDVSYREYDALIIPGGNGLINNYQDSRVVRNLIQGFVDLERPIATMCAGIDLIRKWQDPNLMKEELETLKANEFCYDEYLKLYYTPAFRKSSNMALIQEGIEKMIVSLIKGLEE